MRLADIPQVLEIERESFPSMWPPTAFKRELQQNRLAHYVVITERNPLVSEPPVAEDPQEGGPLGRFIGEIRHIIRGEEQHDLPPPAERPELIIGFVGVWMLPDELHIVTIATRESHRRQGIGEMLLICAIELAQAKDQPMVTLECRISNEAAQRLYEKYGFDRLGIRPRYYSDNQEDAYILTVNSVTGRRFRARFDELKAEHRHHRGDFGIA